MSTACLSGAASFLDGGGETGALIAARDWGGTALGPIDRWPQSLRTALALVLRSSVPIVMLWGEDGIMLYNDAYSAFAGGRHPALLGMKVREAWPEVASFNDNVMRVVLGGGTLAYRDQALALARHGHPEQVWMNLDYSPVIDESGRPAGVIGIVAETTDRVLAQRRAEFLNMVAERLRAIASPGEVIAEGTALLGEYLGVDRVGYCDVREEADGLLVLLDRDWCAPGTPSVAGRYLLSPEVSPLLADYKNGRLVVFTDIRTDPRTAAIAEEEISRLSGARARIIIPLVKDGRLAALLFVHSTNPREWTAEEVALVRDVAERTWAGITRARSEEALRLSEERMRLALIAGKITDWYWNATTDRIRFSPRAAENLNISETFEPSSKDVALAVAEEDRAFVLAAGEAAVATGEPYQIEYRMMRGDGKVAWIATYGQPVRGPAGEVTGVIGISQEITARKEAEQHQKLLINELNHRVKNTLAIVQAISHQSFASEGLSRDARAAFEGRLSALSSAHNLLTEQNWEGASLRQVVSGGMAAYKMGERLCITGPDIPLTPKTAVSIAMAVHELATNAAKYGALSVPEGRVDVKWDAADDRLSLVWRERDGPPVVVPTRRGFGSRMIERGLAAELGGTVSIAFAPEGVVCTVEAPLPHGDAR